MTRPNVKTPRTGGNYPWYLGLDKAERLLDPAAQKP
jgi:hypothetical protein